MAELTGFKAGLARLNKLYADLFSRIPKMPETVSLPGLPYELPLEDVLPVEGGMSRVGMGMKALKRAKALAQTRHGTDYWGVLRNNREDFPTNAPGERGFLGRLRARQDFEYKDMRERQGIAGVETGILADRIRRWQIEKGVLPDARELDELAERAEQKAGIYRNIGYDAAHHEGLDPQQLERLRRRFEMRPESVQARERYVLKRQPDPGVVTREQEVEARVAQLREDYRARYGDFPPESADSRFYSIAENDVPPVGYTPTDPFRKGFGRYIDLGPPEEPIKQFMWKIRQGRVSAENRAIERDMRGGFARRLKHMEFD